MRTTLMIALFCSTTSLGCSFHARDADSYRKATRALLETRKTEVQTCYDAELKKNPNAAGTVVVNFKVEQKTGKIAQAKVDASSDAPAGLSQCVVNAIDGLALDPPDAREGDATFRWEFKVQKT